MKLTTNLISKFLNDDSVVINEANTLESLNIEGIKSIMGLPIKNYTFQQLLEIHPSVQQKIAEILHCDYIDKNDEFESKFSIDINKSDYDNEFKIDLFARVKFVPVFENATGHKYIACINPFNEELDQFAELQKVMVNLHILNKFLPEQINGIMDIQESTHSFIKILLKSAYELNAQDTDITAWKNGIKVRYHINGRWEEEYLTSLPLMHKNHLWRALGNMSYPTKDFIEDEPASYRIDLEIDSIDTSWRTSIVPLVYGESATIRKLPGIGRTLELEELNLSAYELSIIYKIIDKITAPVNLKSFLCFVTGATGHGKSQLQYSIFKRIRQSGLKIFTSEDPVEQILDGIHQVPVVSEKEAIRSSGVKMTHKDALVEALRAHPDLIAIGEVRKVEQVEACIEACITGHHFFTTLHTDNVIYTFYRLHQMGVDLGSLIEVIGAIISTKLLPVLCSQCKIKTFNGFQRNNHGFLNSIERLKFLKDPVLSKNLKVCTQCNCSGYYGKTTIPNIAFFNKEDRAQIIETIPLLINEKSFGNFSKAIYLNVFSKMETEGRYIPFETGFKDRVDRGLIDSFDVDLLYA